MRSRFWFIAFSLVLGLVLALLNLGRFGSFSAVGAYSTPQPPPDPDATINDPITRERNTTLDFTVALSAPANRECLIDFQTVDGTAVAPKDYASNAGTLSIPTGQSSGTVSVQVNQDKRHEKNETFEVLLTNPRGCGIADDTGQGKIKDNDRRRKKRRH